MFFFIHIPATIVLETFFSENIKSSWSHNNHDFCFCHRSNNPTHKYFLAVDPVTGALFISDTNSRRIYRVRSLTGGRLLSDNAEVVAGTGEQCLPFDERCGDGGKATEATLMSPKGDPLTKFLIIEYSIMKQNFWHSVTPASKM